MVEPHTVKEEFAVPVPNREKLEDSNPAKREVDTNPADGERYSKRLRVEPPRLGFRAKKICRNEKDKVKLAQETTPVSQESVIQREKLLRVMEEHKAKMEELETLKARVQGELDTTKAQYVQLQKNPTAPKKAPPKAPVYVVDKHHDVLLPIFAGMKAGTIPTTGLKMLHFDSHPDMGCLPDTTPKTLLANLQKGTYDGSYLHKKCDIATWVLTLIMAGHVDELVWVSGWWCNQMDPGTYDLQIGIHQNTMKVAPTHDDECTEEAVGLYWQSGSSWVPASKLSNPKPWKFHVVRLQKNGRFSVQDMALMQRLFGSNPWLLDFDEDFVSCSNPFQEEFKDLFGEAYYEVLQKTYEPLEDAAAHWNGLHSLISNGTYLQDKEKYTKHPTVQKLKKNTPEHLLLQFQALCRGLYDPPEAGKLTEADVFSAGLVHVAGEACGLPHHISTAKEIATVLNTTQLLFAKLGDPRIVTVATSRADKYLPDSQACHIHRLLTQILCKRYRLDPKDVVRMDRPEYSVVHR